MYANIDCIEEFLNEKKAYVPCLTKVIINCEDLRIVTKNFTREETRHNCTKVKEIFLFNGLVQVKDLYHYFPSRCK